MEQALFLDPAIAKWVLLPITLVLLLVGVVRHYLVLLLNSPPKQQPRKAQREQRGLTRGQILRSNGLHLSKREFEARREVLLVQYKEGAFLQKKKQQVNDKGEPTGQPDLPPNPLTDPAAMDGVMSMVKKQAVMFIPQSILMGWVNLFFSGFVTTRLPFPLTVRFKPMIQRGIETPDMDVTWVSSHSWYFLNLFGLNSIYTLILGGENEADGTRNMQMGMDMAPPMGMPGAPAQDFSKLYNAERENLELFSPDNHKWVGDDVEDRLLKRYRSQQV